MITRSSKRVKDSQITASRLSESFVIIATARTNETCLFIKAEIISWP